MNCSLPKPLRLEDSEDSTLSGPSILERRSVLAVGPVWVLVWIAVTWMESGCSTGFQGARGRWSGLQWTDLDGTQHRVAESVGEKGLAMVYVSVDCPIANRCLPEIEALAAEMAQRGLRVVRVYAHAQEGPDEIRRHGAEYGLHYRTQSSA